MLPEITNKMPNELIEKYVEIIQPRSNYQLEHFVIGQHETPEQQYIQCLNEIHNLYYTIQNVSLELKKAELEAERLKATGDEIDAISAELKLLGIEQTKTVAVGAFRELDYLLKKIESYPSFNRNDIEKNEELHWANRLALETTKKGELK